MNARRMLTSLVRRLRSFAYVHKTVPQPPAGPAHPIRLGLALGGGFARGLAHLGVLKVLRENHIPIHAIAGTSVGSIVAASFASGTTIDEMFAAAHDVHWKDFARWTVNRLGLASNERMEAFLEKVIKVRTFEELSISLLVIAADLSTGEPVIFQQGELARPLRASCSFPGLFVPVKYEGRLLVDGAIVGSVPAYPLRNNGIDRILAVHLRVDAPTCTPKNIFQVIGQSFQIAQGLNHATWKDFSDLVIKVDCGSYNWDDFHRFDEIVAEGEKAALAALPGIRALVHGDSRAATVGLPGT